MEANLHLHSRYSDGTLWPEEVAAKASGCGLEAVALTDHDSVGGLPAFLSEAGRLGMEAIAGCEVDCEAPEIGYRSEILAYFPDGAYPRTKAFLDEAMERRRLRLIAYIEHARCLYRREELSLEDLLAGKYGSELGRVRLEAISVSKVDLFLYLRQKGILGPDLGYTRFRAEVLDTWNLAASGIKDRRTTVAELAAIVLADGGYLVVPHIGHEFHDDAAELEGRLNRLVGILSYFRGLGIDGVELYWYRNASTKRINEVVEKAASRLGFFLTYGSDCHGPGSGKDTLGQFSGDFPGFPGRPLGAKGLAAPRSAGRKMEG